MFPVKVDRSSFQQQYLVVLTNGIAILAGVFLLNGLIARIFGIESLGEFLLIKRTVTTIVSVLLIGMNISIPYFLNKSSHSVVFTNSLLLFFFYTLPATGIFILLIQSGVLRGFQANHVWGYTFYTTGICSQFFVYAHFRGRLKFFGASLLQVSATAVIPVLYSLISTDLNQILTHTGLTNLVLSMVFFLMLYRKIKPGKPALKIIKTTIRFGMERFPSFFSQFILLAGPGLLLSFYGNYEEIALINGNISLLRLLIFIMGPLGIIILPRVSRIRTDEQRKKLNQALSQLLELALIFSVLIALFLFIFNEDILSLWLDVNNQHILTLAKYYIVALPLYVGVDIMRSPLDGLSKRGYNSIAFGTAAVVFLITFYFIFWLTTSELIASAAAFIMGYFITVIMMVHYLRTLIDFKLSFTRWKQMLPLIITYMIILFIMASQIKNAVVGIILGSMACIALFSYGIHRFHKQLTNILTSMDTL